MRFEDYFNYGIIRLTDRARLNTVCAAFRLMAPLGCFAISFGLVVSRLAGSVQQCRRQVDLGSDDLCSRGCKYNTPLPPPLAPVRVRSPCETCRFEDCDNMASFDESLDDQIKSRFAYAADKLEWIPLSLTLVEYPQGRRSYFLFVSYVFPRVV